MATWHLLDATRWRYGIASLFIFSMAAQRAPAHQGRGRGRPYFGRKCPHEGTSETCPADQQADTWRIARPTEAELGFRRTGSTGRFAPPRQARRAFGAERR